MELFVADGVGECFDDAAFVLADLISQLFQAPAGDDDIGGGKAECHPIRRAVLGGGVGFHGVVDQLRQRKPMPGFLFGPKLYERRTLFGIRPAGCP